MTVPAFVNHQSELLINFSTVSHHNGFFLYNIDDNWFASGVEILSRQTQIVGQPSQRNICDGFCKSFTNLHYSSVLRVEHLKAIGVKFVYFVSHFDANEKFLNRTAARRSSAAGHQRRRSRMVELDQQTRS